ncbi:MAG: BCCT family transporter [Desulfobacterales bacterium]|nr:BCCT family transporter [Desulfobacterales bacterium]
MEQSLSTQKQGVLDKRIFWPSIIVVLALALPLAIFQEDGKAVVNAIFGFMTKYFGWSFLLFGLGCFFFLLWVALGRYGSIKLGDPEDKPEFSFLSWIGMLFCAGVGSGLMIWSIMEPIYYIQGPPYGIEAFSDQAYEWSAMLPLFHWGFSAWALYGIGVPAIAYVLFVRKRKALRISETVRNVIGDRADGWLGTMIDVFMIFGIVGAIATSLGVAVPMISYAVSQWFGIQESLMLKVAILMIWTGIFGFSVYRGLAKGIKILSDINLYLGLGLLAFVLLCGPTIFIIDMITNSLGLMVTNFFRMSTYLDPVVKSGWPQSWTVFYWAWWLAYLPMMALFVARISKGRTIRQVVLVELFAGAGGCFGFMGILGGYALHLQKSGILDVAKVLSEQGSSALCFAVMGQLPLSGLVTFVFVLLCFIFVATTLDSTAFILASISTRDLPSSAEPSRKLRFTWAGLLAFVAIGLMAVNALKAVQLASVIGALPMIPIGILLCVAFLRYVEEDFGHLNQPLVRLETAPDSK